MQTHKAMIARSAPRSPRVRRLLPVLAVGLAVLMAGCDAMFNADDDNSSIDLSPAFAELASAVTLTDSQMESLTDLSNKYADDDTPGHLWYAAAEVHDELTDEQLATLKKRLQQRRENRPPRGPQFRRGQQAKGQMLTRMVSRLNLTDAQAEDIKSIRDEYRRQLEALREKCRSGDFDESDADTWRELRSEMRDAVLDVLTEEQREKVADWKEKREERLNAIREARQEALELTEEQIEQFAERFEDGPGRIGGQIAPCPQPDRERPGASILTETQKEIVMIHKVLVRKAISTRQQPRP